MTSFLIIAGFLCVAAVTVLDAILTPWHRSMAGRSIFGLLLMLNVVVGLSAARVLFGDYPFRAIAIQLSFAGVIVAVGWIGATIIREQLRGRAKCKGRKQ